MKVFPSARKHQTSSPVDELKKDVKKTHNSGT